MKACCFCAYSFEDEEGVWCDVNWDALEYEPQEKQNKIREACLAAQQTKRKVNT